MDISQHEKRALLADRLTPRVTVANLHMLISTEK